MCANPSRKLSVVHAGDRDRWEGKERVSQPERWPERGERERKRVLQLADGLTVSLRGFHMAGTWETGPSHPMPPAA